MSTNDRKEHARIAQKSRYEVLGEQDHRNIRQWDMVTDKDHKSVHISHMQLLSQMDSTSNSKVSQKNRLVKKIIECLLRMIQVPNENEGSNVIPKAQPTIGVQSRTNDTHVGNGLRRMKGLAPCSEDMPLTQPMEICHARPPNQAQATKTSEDIVAPIQCSEVSLWNTQGFYVLYLSRELAETRRL
ncbi:hypothetical protein VNO78_14079 [Psophocarpus tetragonolobus]|uniref:Uncharacterized protein n=1 Tax=Psophocarpus tetragonolobus TaxID=3891 RepID=A0AAN9SRW5_PSOTE